MAWKPEKQGIFYYVGKLGALILLIFLELLDI